jgi:predicted DNA binding CopG/RHH family protein
MKRYTENEKEELVKKVVGLCRDKGMSLRDALKECHTDIRTYKRFRANMFENDRETAKLNGGTRIYDDMVEKGVGYQEFKTNNVRVLVSINEADFRKLKENGAKLGLKYSTYASSLLHQAIDKIQ